MMMNEGMPGDMKKYIHDLERKIAQLEKDLEKDRADKEKFRQSNKKLKKENEKLKKELARLQGSAPVLAGSDKTAEAGGVPTSKVFYKRNRQEGKEKTNSKFTSDTHHTGQMSGMRYSSGKTYQWCGTEANSDRYSTSGQYYLRNRLSKVLVRRVQKIGPWRSPVAAAKAAFRTCCSLLDRLSENAWFDRW